MGTRSATAPSREEQERRRRRRGLVLLVVTVALYAASFFVIGERFRAQTGMLSCIPTLIVGWYWGARLGATGGLLALAMNAAMNALVLPPGKEVPLPMYALGAFVLVVEGWVMGRFSETTRARQRELEERRRIAEELEQARAELEQRVAERTAELAVANESLRREIGERTESEARQAQLVDERIRLEQQLHHAQKMEAIGRLAGGVAHDFNNLLTAILGFADVARMREGSSRDQAIDQIAKAAERAAELTRSLLTFARRQPARATTIDVNELVRRTDVLLRRLLGEDVLLELLLSSDAHAVRIDAGQLEQVLVNLAVNARDAMPHGGRLRIATMNVIEDGEEWLELSVTDTGVGMSEATLARVFDPFFTTKEPGAGTGLGLATSYGIVTQAGGSIRAHSKLGHGTCMLIRLPRCHEAPAFSEPPNTEQRSRGRETVLLVEDDPQVRTLMEMALVDDGYHVLAADTPELAIELARETRHLDLLLSDVVMPSGSGPEVAEEVRVHHPRVAILFVSGYAPDSLEQRGLPIREAAFLPKPFRTDALRTRVRELLDETREMRRTSTRAGA